jgi:hypothetical protein
MLNASVKGKMACRRGCVGCGLIVACSYVLCCYLHGVLPHDVVILWVKAELFENASTCDGGCLFRAKVGLKEDVVPAFILS